MAHPLSNARFLLSASDVRQLGPCHAEVAFVGRSNVGKSSLLNALVHQKALARVSRTPGRTRLINVFAVEDEDRWIVDLPGYGHASGPKRERDEWQGMIERYLAKRPSLRMVFVLIDAEVGPTPLDAQMLEWLVAHRLSAVVVANKFDKVKPSRRETQVRDIAAALGRRPEAMAWVSAAKGTGVPELRSVVASLLSSD
ncbi:MAG: ribosome biogenesis GTP-binding protein YsxC [Candidatus Eisenbacteria bacterium]|uniref:Probable GTP-binding protein EngB n=1 Tax=Eiseniibacteriota bacterium TaxID=2212470 RepID=A0A933SCP7_UNCEI|nr:ribosome biogenesis GTP-binding protein YsxC [Candidatus Eisenbacteria bacterium]